MSDTLDDILISNVEYVDVNSLSGIEAGTPILVSNKSESVVLLQLSVDQPPADDLDGERLEEIPSSDSIKAITVGENTVWAKSVGLNNAPISVQDNS